MLRHALLITAVFYKLKLLLLLPAFSCNLGVSFVSQNWGSWKQILPYTYWLLSTSLLFQSSNGGKPLYQMHWKKRRQEVNYVELLFQVEFSFSGERDVSVNVMSIELRQSLESKASWPMSALQKQMSLSLSLEIIRGTEKSLNLEMGPNGSR